MKTHFTSVVALIALAALPAFGHSFVETWEATQEGPYTQLPQAPVTKKNFFSKGVNLLAQSAKRTLDTDADVLPHFDKLVHPIGICYAGTWKITAKTPYSGYFAPGAEGLIIVRASEALGQPMKGKYRSFGVAGKIFPTLDPEEARNLPTANFFTVDDLGGTKSASFLELGKTNSPATSFHPSALLMFPTLTTIIKTFTKEESNPAFRPVNAVAELGLADPRQGVSPHLMMVKGESKAFSIHSNSGDFRNELRLKNFPNHQLKFGIHAAATEEGKFTRVGEMVLTQEALSDGCDHRLHFPHPRLRK